MKINKKHEKYENKKKVPLRESNPVNVWSIYYHMRQLSNKANTLASLFMRMIVCILFTG